MTNFTRKTVRRLTAAALTTVTLMAGAACGSSSSSSEQSAAKQDITQQTIKPGTLTIATGDPAYAPYVQDNKPESGKGYEAAVAYAVAEKMGFDKAHVTWTRTTFDAAIAPGSKDYDLNIQQFSITPERRQAVDFTPSYYNSTQSLVVRKDSSYASATSLAQIKDAKIGAMVGSTSYEMAHKLVKPDIDTFNDDVASSQALDANQIDALVVDTPSAVTMVDSKQVKDAKILGQIKGSQDPEGMGIVLPKGSKLTPAASKAVTTLKKDGTLDKLQKQWLHVYTSLPTLG
ncbi:amino acid ABC transporter substrate-binding protein [Bifidobacterium sp. B4107]|uniref:ABC transporter substrate-binding protein n=1 Tax=unclassified Bifidobacterium TaxID=2608897 RepID=UPI00226B1B66|nr:MULTISPECIES: ABC transporter substrate-binding protein [unclassified Bifidobacterium]MCX8646956.1 amino acid ABC transporter substrate-binding protein [Bifidobacterium sp. B4107]MCX8651141.1 amino acid ABC transporter substrate-binding protein [Bifidobacterium sp. B4111]MCX8657571.1 amino acid ABC transporter substrate-binding protein [Bifidobacterium sp. B4114]